LATLVFSGASSSLSQTVSFSGDANFGSISVDIDAATATVALPLNGTVIAKTPAGLGCPIGLWTVAGSGPCDESGASLLIFADGSGGYQTALTIFNDDNNVCTAGSYPSTKTSFDAATKTLSFSVDGKSGANGCDSATIVATFTLTANADCTQMSAFAATTGCGTCSTSGLGCEGCGSLSCQNPTGDTPIATLVLQ
jgi:hypothetical protein